MKRIVVTSFVALVLSACSSNPVPTVEGPADSGSSELTTSGFCLGLNCPPPVKPGSLDTSFGQVLLNRPGTGKIFVKYSSTIPGVSGGRQVKALVVLPDGKLYFVASTDQQNTEVFTRLNTSGTDEYSVYVGSQIRRETNAMAVGTDGKVYDAGGRLDWLVKASEMQFSVGGVGISDEITYQDPSVAYTLRAIAIQADGKIVVAGSAISDPYGRFLVVRYNPDLSTDTTFGPYGNGFAYATATYSRHKSFVTSMAIQADGKIVVAGYDTPANGSTSDFAIVRYNTNGSLDTSFDGDGIARVGFVGYSSDYAKAVKIQTDGKIVVAGYSNISPRGLNQFALARLNSNGSLDGGFGTAGLVTTFFGNTSGLGYLNTSEINSMVLQADGKIVVAGKATSNTSWDDDFALARYNTNGSLDTTFGTGGLVTTSFGSGNDVANAMAIQNGKIVLAGSAYNPNTGQTESALARYNP